MNRKIALVPLLAFLALLFALQTVNSASITSATSDKDTYLPGQTGYISVSIYNDKSDKIRVNELSATIDYYYADGTVYVQKFFTSATLPDEIQEGQTKTYQIPISLPTNIAPGYTNPDIEAKTELWMRSLDRWVYSERATSHVKLYIESPYKPSYDASQQELSNVRNTVNILIATTVVFAVATAFLAFIVSTIRARPIPQDVA